MGALPIAVRDKATGRTVARYLNRWSAEFDLRVVRGACEVAQPSGKAGS